MLTFAGFSFYRVHTYSKFWIAKWKKYDAVVFIDADVLLFRPLDELVELARSVPGSIIAPRAYWLRQPFATSGTFVISPSNSTGIATHRTFDDLLKGSFKAVGASEMDWFNANLKDEINLVSGFYTLLCGEFYPGDGIYKRYGKKLGLEPKELLDFVPLVHFIANWKPWGNGIKEAKGKETPELQHIYERWYDVEGRACNMLPGYQKKGNRTETLNEQSRSE